MVSRTVPAKRKQAADMPESPPKRVTRARAAKVVDEPDATTKTTKITTASAKAATSKKKTAVKVPAKTTKRNKQEEDDATAAPEEQATEEIVEKQTNAKSVGTTKPRQRKTTQTDKVEDQKSEASKPRGRQAKAVAAPAEPETKKTRGRSKKVADSANNESQTAEGDNVDQPDPEPGKKTSTRGRAAATSTSKTTRATAATRSTATKKKVQFQDEQDKENIPILTEGPKKSAMKATGMKAKPVRKPAAPRAATRGRKSRQAAVADSELTTTGAMPLSPKKVNQVAKTPSSSEDELAGEKTPIKSLNKSPFKLPIKGTLSPTKAVGSPAKQDEIIAPSSPFRQMIASVLASPAKRPPQSSFKDGLKSPAKKFDTGEDIAKSLFSSLQTASPAKASLLQVSPRKVKIADAPSHPVLAASQSPFKMSLLQSPARRQFGSPVRAVNASNGRTPLKPKSVEPSPVKGTPVSSGHTISTHAALVDRLNQSTDNAEDQDNEQDLMDVDANMSMSSTPVARPAAESESSSPSIQLVEENEAVMEEKVPSPNSESTESKQDSVFHFQRPTIACPSMDYRRISTDSQLSEDELASPDKRFAPTPLGRQGFTPGVNNTPLGQREGTSLTPLADQFSGWAASSPNKQRPSRQQRGIFSLAVDHQRNETANADHERFDEPSTKSSFFEDDIAMLDAEQETPDRPSITLENGQVELLGASMESAASQEYGDENEVPSQAEVIRAEQEADDPTLTCTPAKVFTPAKRVSHQPREVYTVSKVPLRAAADDSPLKLPRQRSKSLGGALAILVDNEEREVEVPERPVTPNLTATTLPQTPSSGMKLDTETPGRTGRKHGTSDVLKGAVVFVDVHTSEGADASGIFVDLLTQMGARCVKQWSWNPRTSLGDSLDGSGSLQASPKGSPAASKVGITHVVYKDGGVRTLEKFRLSNGVVTCVGVGWVLDCEREDKWLDEANYSIDTSQVPRGGHRRRKSMEPRALANLGGNLIPAPSETPAKREAMSPTKEFLTFNTPASRRDTFVLDAKQVTPEEADELSNIMSAAPATPTITQANGEFEADLAGASPTTPYYLSNGAQLVQRTCPPKQRGEGLFPITGDVDDEPDQAVRQRLIAARRRTLQWSTKTKSPLGRTVSYGK